jgi:hypothetical protein
MGTYDYTSTVQHKGNSLYNHKKEGENGIMAVLVSLQPIRVITKLPNSEQSYKGKVKTHNYINRQNQSTTGKL